MKRLDRIRFDLRLPANRRFQVVGLGLNAVDWIVVLGDYPPHGGKCRIEQRMQLGGGPVATASALCGRFGLETRYVGRVGDDDLGRFSLADLKREPMDISGVETVPGASSQYAVILVDRPTGERTVLWDLDAKLLYKPGELKKEWIIDGQILHLDGLDMDAATQAARWAQEAGMKVSLDIDMPESGVEELLRYTDFAIPSQDFLIELSSDRNWRSGLRELGSLTKGFVAATRGKDGVAVLFDGEVIEIPGFTGKIIDTTGAGDVFHGAFIYALFQNWTVLNCIRFASAAALQACGRYGARASIPELASVQSFLEEAPEAPSEAPPQTQSS